MTVDQKAVRRWVPFVSLALVAGSVGAMCLWYGLLTVPRGMDTMMDTHPPGTVCLIQKTPGGVVADAVVFVDLPEGATVLSRVARVLADGSFEIRHDNRESVFRHLEDLGPFWPADVRGLVVTMFVTEAQGEPALGK